MLTLLIHNGCTSKPPKYHGKEPLTSKLSDCITDSTLNKAVPRYHVLREGETLYRVSNYYNVSLDELFQANNFQDHTDLAIGTKVLIPGLYNHKLNFSWPIYGKVSSGFGNRRRNFHNGIDIPAKKGTPIRASSEGLVIESGSDPKGFSRYGKVIIVQHADGLQSVYAHNNKNVVKTGQCVKVGEHIAEVGNSGNATGSHLHFEIRKDNKPVNPLNYLPSGSFAQ